MDRDENDQQRAANRTLGIALAVAVVAYIAATICFIIVE